MHINMGSFAYSTSFVIFLVILVLFFVKKWLEKFKKMNGDIRLISTLLLGPKEKVYILEVDHKRILIGSTQYNINMLLNLEDCFKKSIEHEIKKIS